MPKPPFRFEREDLSGTQLKVFVRDGNGTDWNVKFGYEVKTESFCWRIVRACGYFAEPSFLVQEGGVEGLGALRRADPTLHADGSFRMGRFQFRDPHYRFLQRSWSWTRNPFLGTPQFAGLKILIMLFSNYDNKDSSNRGSNTAVFLHGNERIYAFTDWGAGMGKWGHLTGQNNWRCEDYTAESPAFVTGRRRGFVRFGYEGGHLADFDRDIRTSDAAWLLRYLGRITDEQILGALRASGANPGEDECFRAAIRARIDALRRAAK